MADSSLKTWKDAVNETVIRVTYRDTDQMNVVYYANYLVWFEIGRTELIRDTGHTYKELENLGVILPVTRAVCDYKKPARYDELVIIRTWISDLKRVSVTFHYQIIHKSTGDLLAEGETRHGMIDFEGKVVKGGHIIEKWLQLK